MADNVVEVDTTSFNPPGFSNGVFWPNTLVTTTFNTYFNSSTGASFWHNYYFTTMHYKYIEAQNDAMLTQQKSILAQLQLLEEGLTAYRSEFAASASASGTVGTVTPSTTEDNLLTWAKVGSMADVGILAGLIFLVVIIAIKIRHPL